MKRSIKRSPKIRRTVKKSSRVKRSPKIHRTIKKSSRVKRSPIKKSRRRYKSPPKQALIGAALGLGARLIGSVFSDNDKSKRLVSAPMLGIGTFISKAKTAAASASTKVKAAASKASEIKAKAEAAAKQAVEKGQQLQAKATELADKAVKATEELQKKADQIQQQAQQVQQQYEQAKANVASVGATLKTLPPSNSPAVIASQIKASTAPIQSLRRPRRM